MYKGTISDILIKNTKLSANADPVWLFLQTKGHKMAGSTLGNLFKITILNGNDCDTVTIDGCPSGLSLSENDIKNYLKKNKAYNNTVISIQSGLYDGRTNGMPLIISATRGNAAKSGKLTAYRPGTPDYAFSEKYGHQYGTAPFDDTACILAGAVAVKILGELGISFCTYVSSIGPVRISYSNSSLDSLSSSALNMPDSDATERAAQYLDKLRSEGNTTGGVIECLVSGMPAGLGEPFFNGIDAVLAKALFSLAGVRGFEIGAGFDAASMKGSENNDAFTADASGKITKKTNNAGGILGGISDGSELVLRTAFSPSADISSEQETIDTNGKPAKIKNPDSHTVCTVPDSCLAVEAMTAITITDMLFENMTSKLDKIVSFYK